jgi:3-hydroxybutyryl-CoA dehydrogenase
MNFGKAIPVERDKNKMKILIIGEMERASELERCISSVFEIKTHDKVGSIDGFDIIIDMNADEKDFKFSYHPKEQLVIVSAVKKRLSDISAALAGYKKMVGMNFLPTMTERELKEVSFLDDNSLPEFENFTRANNWKYKPVKDHEGMVTPRVLAMIINEAAYTFEEGTATKEDIDKGMMLGTNYPIGPFAWCDKIGVRHIVEILQALYSATADARYTVCKLLLEKNEKKEKFY